VTTCVATDSNSTDGDDAVVESDGVASERRARHPVARTAAWAALGAESTTPLGDLLGAPVVPTSITELAESASVLCVALTLVDAARGCEVVASVLATRTSTHAIGKQMLGEETTYEDAAEALAEVVNVVAGVVKAAFVDEGFSFTLGLPAEISATELEELQASAVATTAIHVALGEHAFALSYLVTQSAATRVLAEDLHEGWVLAQDLRVDGVLVMAHSTRLTEGAARSIRETCRGLRVLAYPPIRAESR